MNIIEKLKELGYSTIPQDFYSKVEEWRSWYVGNVKNFSHYKVRTGKETVHCKRYSLGMAKKMSEDWANLLMNEKVKITLEGTREQEFIDRVFEDNNFWVRANEMQERKSALGTVAYIPRVVGAGADGTGGYIVLDCATIEDIFPLRWENGYISECAFTSRIYYGENAFVYLQVHKKGDGGLYEIENRLYRLQNDNLQDAALADIPDFANIPPVVRTGSDKRLFVIDRPNIVNNFDAALPVGVPVFANAIDLLKGVDIAYDGYVNEFVLGKRRIMVKPSAMEYLDGEPVFDASDTVYYVLPEDVQDGAVITPIDFALRTGDFSTGIQDLLNILANACGFGETYYRFDGGSVATATQVVSENSTTFRTVKKHEIVLEAALTELCRIILRLGNSAMKLGIDEDVEISIDFDDSIIEDKQQEFNRTLQLLNAGLMRAEEARAMLMNEDIETARKALPTTRDLTDEKQEEVE